MLVGASACTTPEKTGPADLPTKGGRPEPSQAPSAMPTGGLTTTLEDQTPRETKTDDRDGEAKDDPKKDPVTLNDKPPIVKAPPPQTMPPRDDKPVVAQVVTADLEGKLDQSTVVNTIDQNASRLTVCLTTDSTITLRLKVLPSGKVGEAHAQRSIPNDQKMRDCIVAAFRTISFPRLEGNEAANLSLDLTLKKS